MPPQGAPDVCGECYDLVVGRLDSLLAAERVTVTGITTVVPPEDEWAVAEEDLSDDEYWRYMEADADTTLSLVIARIRNALGPGARQGSWRASPDGEVCRVALAEHQLELTIGSRPRCLITEIRHRGASLFAGLPADM
jgi:hypothetical protein